MSSIQFRNVIIPAVLMSSVVFSALTLPLVLFEPEPHTVPLSDAMPVEEPSTAFQGFQPILDIFESGNKGLAIRYIGFSIVASVGAGIVTAELMRQTARRFALVGDRFSSLAMNDETSDLSTVLPEWANALAIEATEQEIPIPAHLPTQELAMVGAAASRAGYGFESATAVLNTPTTTSPVETLSTAPESVAVPVLDESAGYETCRINVPYLEKRLFAVLFEGDYYRLVKARKTREAALAIAIRLRQHGNRIIVTQDDETFSVWIFEPKASLCPA